MTSERTDRVELLQGTLDLIVLRALATMGSQHAYSLAARLEQVGTPSLTVNQGTLYPALVRLEHKGWIKGAWQRTEHNRERSEEHTSELQSRLHLVCRLLLEKKKNRAQELGLRINHITW